MSVNRGGRRAGAGLAVLAAALAVAAGAQAQAKSRAFWSSFEPADPAASLLAGAGPRVSPAGEPGLSLIHI